MKTLEQRICEDLEPVLSQPDPRVGLSTYHDMPCALLLYRPEEEFQLRRLVAMLGTRLAQRGKQVHRISLAECLDEAMRSQGTMEQWFAVERQQGMETVARTVHEVLSRYSPLVEHVVTRMPEEPDPGRDIVLLTRAGALFPMYRTSALLDHLRGRLGVPTILLYPGFLDGASGLRFMGVVEPEHHYRLKVF